MVRLADSIKLIDSARSLQEYAKDNLRTEEAKVFRKDVLAFRVLRTWPEDTKAMLAQVSTEDRVAIPEVRLQTVRLQMQSR